jgi:WD40 repeat protein
MFLQQQQKKGIRNGAVYLHSKTGFILNLKENSHDFCLTSSFLNLSHRNNLTKINQLAKSDCSNGWSVFFWIKISNLIFFDKTILKVDNLNDHSNSNRLNKNSKYFVLKLSNSDVKIWDYQLGICVKELSGHASSINCIEIITNKYVISAGYKEVKIWNIDSSKAEKTIICHQNWIKCLKVLSRNIFITGSFDNKLKMWNSSTGECLKVFSSHTESVWCIELFSDDKFFTSSRDRTIKLWSYLNGECIKTIQF